MTLHNPDILADNHARANFEKDMEDEVISDTLFDVTKGKRNWRALCISNLAVSDQSTEYSFDGARLPVKLMILDTLENILPHPCDLKFDELETKKIISYYPTAYSEQPYNSRFKLPSFGDVVRVNFSDDGPANLGKHRSIQYKFVTSVQSSLYKCKNKNIVAQMITLSKNKGMRTLGDREERKTYGPGVRTGRCRPPGTKATKVEILKAYPAAQPIVDDIISLANELGITDPGWLANLINMESSFNHKAVNRKSGASGLIQFMPETAISYGTTVQKIRKMTAKEQWPYIRKYLKGKPKRWSLAADVYMSVFYPWGMGKPPNTSLAAHFARRKSKQYEDTNGRKGIKGYDRAYSIFTSSNPGIVTKQDYANKANRKAKLPTHFCAEGEKP